MKPPFILLVALYILLNTHITAGQETDRFRGILGYSMAILPVGITDTRDIGKGHIAFIDGYELTSEPIYKTIDTSAILANVIFHLGMNIPFYRSEYWSIGTKLQVGFGLQAGLRDEDALNSLVFDFPQYLYYRNFKTNIDFSVLLGIKHASTVLPYNLFLVAFDWNKGDHSSLRIYGSPIRYKYYRLFTNGTMEPTIKIGELGIGYAFHF